jgi:GTP cyclohydrolase IA
MKSALANRTESRKAGTLSVRPPDIQDHISNILKALGEKVDREGLRDTPKRYEKAMRILTSGYEVDIEKLVGSAVFREKSDGMVLIRDIELFSLCEHHLLPFFGKAHVAYLPDGKVIGLSKVPRLVDAFSRRLQVQERLTRQIAEGLSSCLQPKGVAVIIEAAHLCVMMRGVEKQKSVTITSHLQGAFREDKSLRQELLSLLGRNTGTSL